MNGMGLGQLGGLGRLGQSAFAAGKWPSWMADMDMGWDFTRDRKYNSLDPTDTHASTIYAPNAAGVYTPYAANVLTRTDLGLQTVPTRTNSILNNSMVGAVNGVIGSGGQAPTGWSPSATGLTRTIVGTGTENGLPYIDIKLDGTTGSTVGDVSFTGLSAVAAVNGQTWTTSCFFKLVGGSLTNVSSITMSVQQWTSAPAFISSLTGSDIKSTITSSIVRAASVVTTNAASVAYLRPNVIFGWPSGVVIDFTIRLYAPQLELGAFASPPILTTTAAVTVNGNQQVISGLDTQLAVGVAGVVQATYLQLGTGLTERFLDINDGTANNRFLLAQNATVFLAIATAGGVQQAGITDAYVPSIGNVLTIAFALGTNYSNFRIVGRASPTPDTSVTYPSGMTQLAISGRGFDVTPNRYGYTRKLALKFGPQDAWTFAQMYALAQIAAAA